MKPGNGSSCGNSTGSGTTGTVTMADGITHTVRGAGEMHTLAEHDSKSQL